MNLLRFVLCLLGIQAWVAKREVAAGGWLVAATAIKLTPLFFLAWAVIRGSRRSLGAIARLHHYVGGYSVIVWVMLLLFVLSLVWSPPGEQVRSEK